MAMKRWQRLFRLGIFNEIATLWRLMWHRSVPLGAKATVIVAIAYVFWPVDLIPDFIPVVGWVDDVTTLTGLIYLAYRMVPPPLMEQLRKRKKVDATVHAE